MKRNLIAICSAILAVCTAPGCMNDPDTDSSSEVYREGRISAVAESFESDSEESRTSIDMSDMFIRWSENDAIGLFGSESGSNVKAVLDASFAGQRVGEFVYDMSSSEVSGDVVGYYPYNASSSLDGNLLKVFLPKNQYFTTLNDAISACIMCARQNADGSLAFYNVCSILEVKLTGSEKVYAVDVMSREKSLCGWGTVDIEAEMPAYVSSTVVDGDGLPQGGVHANLNGEVTLSGEPLSLFFVIPAGDYAEGDLYVQVITESYATTRVSSKIHNVLRNHVKPFRAIEVAPTVYSAPVDLSINESGAAAYANCYVVRPGAETKDYKFSIRGVDGTLLCTAPYSAQVAWQTSDGLVTNVSTNISEGTVSFTVPGNNVQGSAILTINTYTDTGIYWAWHIWVSEVSDQTWGTTPQTMQDRNLGAQWKPENESEVKAMTGLTAAATGGFYYQWGRPIPLPMARSFETTCSWGYEAEAYGSNTQDIYVNRFYRWTQGFTNKSVNAGISNAKWYPMSMLKITDSSSPYQDSWANDIETSGSGATWNKTKTNYDPCPVGYRVPELNEALYLRYSDGSQTRMVLTHYDPLNDKTWKGSNEGVSTFGGYATVGDNFIWIPKAGNRASGNTSSASKTNVEGYTGCTLLTGFYYNSSSNNAVATGAAKIWTFSDDGLTAPHYGTTSSNPYPLSSGPVYQRFLLMTSAGNIWAPGNVLSVATACPVRCVKIQAGSTSGVGINGMTEGPEDTNEWK